MNVYLTFDIEVWCGSWQELDARFPPAFERYIHGRSAAGEYALPKTLEILNRHGLRGVFFVEPLFSARFGAAWLERICRLIQDAGQEIQLHLHPEWTDEIQPPVFPDKPLKKRQHLIHYDRAEQTRLVALSRELLEAAAGTPVTAFRAGSFAANRDTLAALAANGIAVDSSLNAAYPLSGEDLRGELDLETPQRWNGVELAPMSIFRDGLGKLRHAQIGACSFAELRQAMDDAQAQGRGQFVILSHNFELLRSGTSLPDAVVVRRFDALCRHLAAHRERLPTRGFADYAPPRATTARLAPPRVGKFATLTRYAEQALRRLPPALSPLR